MKFSNLRRLLFLMAFFYLFNLHAWPLNAVLYDGTGTSAENRIAAMTLAGIVNREQPRLYLLNVYEAWSYNQTDEMWRDIYAQDGGVSFTVISDINELVQFFINDINGAITYDPTLTYGNFDGQNFRWQAEVAAMIGGLTDCIPLPYSNNTIQINRPDSVWVPDHFNGQQPIKISARLELEHHPWNNTELTQQHRYFHILDWALETLLSRTNTRKFYLREITDWAVNKRMFQLNLAGTESLNFYSLSDEKAEKIEQVMTYLQQSHPDTIFHVYGWMRPEPLVQWISAWGGSFHETLLSNLSWHHVFPADDDFDYHRPSIVQPEDITLEDKHYVIFIGSEGDTGNWNMGFQAGAWHSASRGQVPLGWGFNLHFFREFPFLAQYYFRTSTEKDGFISVTNPLGYAYADMFPDSYLPNAIERAAWKIERFSVPSVYAYKHYNGAGVSAYRGVVISNNYDFYGLAEFSEASGAQLTYLFDPGLGTQTAYTQFGGLLFNHVNDNTFYADVTSLPQTAQRILDKLTPQSRPGFLLAGYQRLRHDAVSVGSGNPADITLPRLKAVMDMVQADPAIGHKVEFVTPEQFAILLQKSIAATAVNETAHPSGDFSIYRNASGNLSLQLFSEKNDRIVVNIYDVSGRLVSNNIQYVQSGQNSLFIPANGLVPGVYVVSAANSHWARRTRFVY